MVEKPKNEHPDIPLAAQIIIEEMVAEGIKESDDLIAGLKLRYPHGHYRILEIVCHRLMGEMFEENYVPNNIQYVEDLRKEFIAEANRLFKFYQERED